MTDSSGLNPVLLALARYQPVAPARAAADDCKLFADSLAGADMGLAQALAEALMPRATRCGSWSLQFVLHLAHRGRVSVSARYEHHGWLITLRAQQSATRRWLARQQQPCQRRLARALGQCVRIRLLQECQ